MAVIAIVMSIVAAYYYVRVVATIILIASIAMIFVAAFVIRQAVSTSSSPSLPTLPLAILRSYCFRI